MVNPTARMGDVLIVWRLDRLWCRRDRDLCVWAFDLLHRNGRDLRELPMFERRARLEKLILPVNANWLRYSESFDDGIALLMAADRMALERIVS
jgi:bifunctional non-homologous end joining protein LigD